MMARKTLLSVCDNDKQKGRALQSQLDMADLEWTGWSPSLGFGNFSNAASMQRK